MKKTPNITWDSIKILRDGFTVHHAEEKSMKFRIKDGIVAMTDKDNAEITRENFTRAINRDAKSDWDHVNEALEKKSTMYWRSSVI